MSTDLSGGVAGSRTDLRPPGPQEGVRSRGRAARAADAVTGYVLMTPNLVLLVLFLFVPLVWAVLLSFQRVGSFGPSAWVGLSNYRQLFADPVFWRTLANTLLFTAVTVPSSVAIGVCLAVLLDKAMPARKVFRTMIYLPIVISGLVTSLIGLLLFDEGVGILDGILSAVGIGRAPWQTNGVLAMASLIVMTLWTRVGFAMVVYLAALQDLSPEMYEAAELDGATPWQRFTRITVPMLRPTTLFLVVVNVIWSFQIFDVVYIMTNGGPANATSMLVTYAYNRGFGPANQYGYGSTIGIVLFVLTLLLTVVQLRLRRGAEDVQ